MTTKKKANNGREEKKEEYPEQRNRKMIAKKNAEEEKRKRAAKENGKYIYNPANTRPPYESCILCGWSHYNHRRCHFPINIARCERCGRKKKVYTDICTCQSLLNSIGTAEFTQEDYDFVRNLEVEKMEDARKVNFKNLDDSICKKKFFFSIV